MRIYLNFCSSVYHFYLRKRDRMPDAMAFWVTTTILSANFFAVYNFISYYYLPDLPFSVVFAFIAFGAIALLNYLAIFLQGTYKREKPSAQFGVGVVIYMMISIACVIYTGALHRERNLHKKQLQMELRP